MYWLVWQAATSLDIVGITLICVQQYQYRYWACCCLVAAMCERERNDIKSTTTNQQSAHGSHYLAYQRCCKTILQPLPLTLLSSRRLLQAAGHAYRHSRQSRVPHDETISLQDLFETCASTNSTISRLCSSRPLTKLRVGTRDGSARALIRSRSLSIKS